MVAVPADLAEAERLKAERAHARRCRYEERTGRKRHDANDTRPKGHQRETHYRDYPFIAWDGEATTDTGYSLFGSSDGNQVCSPSLTTEECFDLLLASKLENPHSIFVWFGGRYDWDEITRASMPLDRLARLKAFGHCYWHGYRLTEREGKFYEIRKDGVTVIIYEIFGWFHKEYTGALRDYGIGTEYCNHPLHGCMDICNCTCLVCQIQTGKERRGEFTWADIESGSVTRYMGQELALMPPLMNSIRKICLDAGFDPRGWYGPSALAAQLLSRNKIRDYMTECPEPVNLAARYAYIGGRFEEPRGGITGPGYIYDQNTAYMYAALDLPSLRHGKWRHTKGQYESGKFAVYHIRYKYSAVRRKGLISHDAGQIYPLPRRYANGNVDWPARTETWVWSPEAELVKDDPDAQFIEAYVFDEDNPSLRPFSFVSELFRQRLVLQSLPEDNPSRMAEKAFKWALAAIYGQLCRRVGWNRFRNTAPPTHQLEWAGYITSKCRAEMYKLALRCGDKLISIDTDSVTALCKIDMPLGRQIGEWKVERFDEGVFFQNGVYFTKTDGTWSAGKSRGMERRRGKIPVSPGILTDAIRTGRAVRMVPRRRYVTTRMALAGQFEHHGEWREHPGNILDFGGGGKRYHNVKMCPERCNGDIHVFTMKPPPSDGMFNLMSVPHYLPWKDKRSRVIDVPLTEDILWADTDRIDTDDEWLAVLIDKERITVGSETDSSCVVPPVMPAHTRRRAMEHESSDSRRIPVPSQMRQGMDSGDLL